MENEQIKTSSENPISDYVDGIKQLELQTHAAAIRKARVALFVTAGVMFAGEMIGLAISNLPFTPLAIVIALIEAGIFVGLAFLTKKKPFTAIVIGLVIFIGLWIFAIVVVGGRAAIGGIIIRIIIISYLVSALKGAREIERARD